MAPQVDAHASEFKASGRTSDAIAALENRYRKASFRSASCGTKTCRARSEDREVGQEEEVGNATVGFPEYFSSTRSPERNSGAARTREQILSPASVTSL